MSLEEYKKLLEAHDWYYMMSDDNRVYREGTTAEANLKAKALGSDEFKRAYNEAYAKRFHNNPFTTPHHWPFKEVAP
jgi:hypothetical protein